MTTQPATTDVDGRPVTRVASRDGVSIAYRTSGDGPPLVVVHGTTGDSTRWRPLLPHLEPHATVHAMDRRGRGESGDADPYDIRREFEDVAAVIDAVAEASGSPVDLYGHSYGGLCAFGGAALTSNVRRVVLYEGWPSVNPDALAFPPGVGERIDELVAAGQREAALETFMRELVGVSDEQAEAIRSQPSWRARVAAAHTITREVYGMQDAVFDPAWAARITVPVLLVTGADTPDHIKDSPELVAAALPDARTVVIEGQAHLADVLAPDVFAAQVLAFLGEGR